ncbi:MAG: hypothetical protein WCR42_13080 [bacterium]
MKKKFKYELKSLIVIFLLMTNIVIILIFLLKFKTDKIEVDEQFYNIEVWFKKESLPQLDGPFPTSYKGYYDEPSKWMFKQKFMYSYQEEDQYFKNNYLEIEFVRALPPDGKPGFCRIGIEGKAFIICWVNGVDEEQSLGRIYGYGLPYSSDIGIYTDSIYSNIPQHAIKKMYPDFKGHYKQLHVKRILIDNNYSIYTRDFYSHIEFDNFRFGVDFRDRFLNSGE